MCDPVSLTLAFTAATGAMTAYGQYQQGKSESNMYKYQADLADNEATRVKKAADANVNATQGAAAEESKKLQRSVTTVAGAQKAATSALGIGGVTAADIALDTFDKARLDQMAIRYNADVKSWEIREKAKSDVWALNEEAGMYRSAAKNAKRAANINVATTVLSTAASMATIGMTAAGKAVPSGGNTANVSGMGKVPVAPNDYYKSSAARVRF